MLPHDTQAELFAAALIVDGGKQTLNAFPWTEEHFSDIVSLRIYQACVTLAAANQKIDSMSVTTEANKDGKLAGIAEGYARVAIATTEGSGMSGSADYYFSHLSELLTRRKAILAAKKAVVDLESGDDPQDVAEIFSLASKSIIVKEKPDLKSQLSDLLTLIESNKGRERFPTGLKGLDDALDGGAERGEFVVYAGETSMGKSVLLQMAAAALGASGRKVVVYGLEMPAAMYLSRMAANIANHAILFRGDPDKGFLQAISRAVNTLGAMKLIIRDDLQTLTEIKADAENEIAEGADAIVIDYIQRVQHSIKGSNREEVISTIARTCKNLAFNNNVVVYSATQLNDDGRVRESRTISHEADILGTIQNGYIILDKFRRGERFKKIGCKLNGALARFDKCEIPEDEPKKKYGR